MSIASRITAIEEHIGDVYDTIDYSYDTTGVNKNIINIPKYLKKGYLDIINNGIDTLYNNFPKVSGIGSNLSLTPTYKAPIKLNEIQGDTLQDGTPTPSSPVPIQSVTGLQNVTISNVDNTESNTYEVNLGKNMLDYSTMKTGFVNSSGGLTTPSTGSITQGEKYSTFIKVKPNTQYIFKIFETSSTYDNWFGVGEYTSNDLSTFIQRDTMTTASQNYISFTTSPTTQYIVASARNLAQATKVQLEKGNETSYSPYFPPYELNKIGDYEDSIKKSTGKNLFDKDSIVGGFVNADGSVGGDTNAYRTSDFIPIKPNTTYYKTSTESPRTKYYDSNKQPLNTTTYQDISIGGNAGTFTTPNNAYYLRFSYPVASVNVNTIQINEGSTELPYEPYGKVWYVEKNTKKIILDGSETPSQINTSSTNTTRVSYNHYADGSTGTGLILCNILSYVSNWSSDTVGISYDARNGGFWFRINKTTIGTTQTEVQNWLSSNNLISYIALATPIYEVITNTELIEQLETLYNAKSKNGTTNINVTSEDLSMILNVGVLKGE